MSLLLPPRGHRAAIGHLMARACCGCRGQREKPRVAKPRQAFGPPAPDRTTAGAVAPAAPAGPRGAGAPASGPPQPKQLLRAAKDDNVARVLELLDLGLDMEHKGMWGNTPLLCACAYGCPGVADALVKRGADCTVRNDDGATPLLLACMEGLDEAALGMLAHGDVNTWPPAATVYNQVVDSSEAQTPLRVACQNGRAALVRALLAQDVLSAAPDAAAIGSALVAAAKHGREEVVDLLLSAGVDPMAPDENGATAADVGTVEVKDLLAAREKASARKPAAANKPAGPVDQHQNESKGAPVQSLDSARGPEPALPTMHAPDSLPPLEPQPPRGRPVGMAKPPHNLPPLPAPVVV